MTMIQQKSNKIPYGFLYKTILPDGRFYIGQHKIVSQKTLDPYYFGSGVIIRDYIKSKTAHDLKREILVFGYSFDEMNLLESIYVTEEILNDPLCINLDKGGKNKFSRYDLVKDKISESMKKVRASNKDWKTRKGPENNKSKNWKLISPQGEIFEFCGNINDFCREKNISANTMKAAIRGGWIPKRGVCAGWLGFDLDTGNGTTRETKNYGEAIMGTNNPSHKAKVKRMKTKISNTNSVVEE
jgi:hypothetical protein